MKMDVLNKKVICQSCGMPMKKQEDFGTEQDGELSEEYCKHCYNNGKFTDEGITLKEKTEKLIKISVEQLGMSEDQARTLAENTLPNLKRWKK
jgi:hypothetical protein